MKTEKRISVISSIEMASILTFEDLRTCFENNINHQFGFIQPVSQDTYYPRKVSGRKSVLNAYRRMLADEVETLAISQVEVTENNSQYNSEYLSNRLNFITLLSDYMGATIHIGRLEQGQVGAIKNDSNEIKMYYVYDMYLESVQGVDGSLVQMSIEELCPHNSLLFHLKPGESIQAKMVATRGLGVTHPRWKSSHVMYKYWSKHDELLETSGADALDRPETNEQQLMSRTHSPIGTMVFCVESFGKMRSEDIYKRAYERLKDRIVAIIDKIDSAGVASEEETPITFETDKSGVTSYTIYDEGHTLGMLLQDIGLEYLETIDISERVKYMSNYQIPHPRLNKMMYNCKFPEETSLLEILRQWVDRL